MQSGEPGLPEVICAILAGLKQADTVANMENILAKVVLQFPGLPAQPKQLLGLVHRTLGQLIKQRKVYYTGKGYFLVVPERPVGEPRYPGPLLAQLAGHTPALHPATVEQASQTEPGAGPRSPVRDTAGSPVTLASSSPGSSSSSHSPPASPASPGTAANLERSQSFRLNKRAAKSLAKGGSLRLNKKEAAVVAAEGGQGPEEEERQESPDPRPMERKGSVLGRLFGRKKSK